MWPFAALSLVLALAFLLAQDAFELWEIPTLPVKAWIGGIGHLASLVFFTLAATQVGRIRSTECLRAVFWAALWVAAQFAVTGISNYLFVTSWPSYSVDGLAMLPWVVAPLSVGMAALRAWYELEEPLVPGVGARAALTVVLLTGLLLGVWFYASSGVQLVSDMPAAWGFDRTRLHSRAIALHVIPWSVVGFPTVAALSLLTAKTSSASKSWILAFCAAALVVWIVPVVEGGTAVVTWEGLGLAGPPIGAACGIVVALTLCCATSVRAAGGKSKSPS